MKRYVFLAVMLMSIFLFSPSTSSSWSWPEDFTFVGLEKMAQEIKKSVFSVQTEGNLRNESKHDDYKHLGTGFLLLRGNTVVGITCDHVIQQAKIKNKPILVGLDTGKGFQRFVCKIAFHDQNKDIAILLPQRSKTVDIDLENLVLDKKYLAKEEEIKEGSGIIIPGYPLGLGLEHNENHPIIKFGIVAQYIGGDSFLVDGVANPGSSGSPVFDLRRAKFIGMVQSYKTDYITLYDEREKISARLPYNSGLSSALSASVISRALEKARLN
jgi:hypothetical protein